MTEASDAAGLVISPPPASGAWRPGDPVGRRQFFTLPADRSFLLEGGGSLDDVVVAYETWGSLDDEASNAVLVCHAWTGDSHVTGPVMPGHVAARLVGGRRRSRPRRSTPSGSSSCAPTCSAAARGRRARPRSSPSTGRPYGARFPAVTIRDMVRVQAALARHLGIDKWLCVVGGSMGGMQVLEWGVTYPTGVRSLLPIAACAQATAQQIALGSVGRRAVRLDPKWRGGDYYDAAPGDGPHEGLAVARQIAQITFRSDDVFTDRFGREMADVAGRASRSGSASRSSATSTTTATSSCAASTRTPTS